MRERVQLLGIAVDIASTKVASEASIQLLNEVCSKVIYFVNSETLLLLQNHADQETVLESCEMVLPGTVSVNASVNEALGHKRDPFFLESYFDDIFSYAIEHGCELMLIAGNQEQYESVQTNIHEQWPYLTLSGVFLTEQDASYEHIVNEVNSIAPDVLIMALDETTQLNLLSDYRNQMNAGLIIFTGNILYNKAVSEAKVPESIEKLKIGNLYKWFRKDNSGKSLFNNIRMKLKLKQDKQDQ